jgi:hypothetical protein
MPVSELAAGARGGPDPTRLIRQLYDKLSLNCAADSSASERRADPKREYLPGTAVDAKRSG